MRVRSVRDIDDVSGIGTIQSEGDLRAFVLREQGELPQLVTQLQGDAKGPVLHAVGGSGEPAFENGWVNFDAERVAAFYLSGTRVFLQGLVKSGTVGATIFTLPAGFVPKNVTTAANVFAVNSNGAFGGLSVFADGRVVCSPGSNVFVSLDGVSFRVL